MFNIIFVTSTSHFTKYKASRIIYSNLKLFKNSRNGRKILNEFLDFMDFSCTYRECVYKLKSHQDPKQVYVYLTNINSVRPVEQKATA